MIVKLKWINNALIDALALASKTWLELDDYVHTLLSPQLVLIPLLKLLPICCFLPLLLKFPLV